jgi:HK97 family phage major capsid protein
MAAHMTYQEWRATHPPIKGGAPVTIEEYEARQDELRGRIAEIDQEYAGQRMSEDSKQEWNRCNKEFEDNKLVIDELRARAERVDALSKDPDHVERVGTFNTNKPSRTGSAIWDVAAVRMAARSPEDESQMLRDNALRAIQESTFPHERANTQDAQTHIERLMNKFDGEDDQGYGSGAAAQFSRHILMTGSPTYRKAFGKAVLNRPLTADEQRALSLTGASGGFAVPVTLDPTIIPTSNGAVNPWRQISRVESIVGSNTWRGVSAGAVVASRDAEFQEVSDDTPTLAQPEATVTKAQAFVPFSMEVGQDWGRLEAEMARLIQDAKDVEEATAFATGAGTGVNPEGVLTGATGTVAAGTASFAVAHGYALLEALPPRFRPNGTFVANLVQYNRIRQLDTSGGASLWVENLQSGVANDATGATGYRFLGRPAYESSVMSSTLTAGQVLMIFGDFRYFLIVDRIGMSIEIVPHLFGSTNLRPTGSRGLLAYWRNTSKVLSSAAFKKLVTT